MVAAGNAGEADYASHTVCDPGDPAMVAVAVRDDRRDCKSRHGVHRIKAARVKRIVSAIKEAIYVRAIDRVLQGPLSAGNALESQVERETICESFRGKECGGLRVGILFDETDGIDRCWNGGDECSSVHSAEDAIKAAEAVCCPEIRSAVRVGSDERGCDSHDGDSRKPVLGFGQASWKEPNLLLIGGEIRGESAEGDLAIGCSGGSRSGLLCRHGGGSRVRGVLGKRGRRGGKKREQKRSAKSAAH